MDNNLRLGLIENSEEVIELREDIEVKGEAGSPLSGTVVHC